MGQLRGGSFLAAVDTSCSAPLADLGSCELVVSAQLCLLSSLPQSSEPSVFILIHLTPHPPTRSLSASTLMWGSGSQWGCSSDLALGLTSVWKPGGTAQSVKSHEKSDSLPSPPICRGFSCFHNTFPACDLRRCSQPILPAKKAKTNAMTCPRPEPELRTFSTKS